MPIYEYFCWKCKKRFELLTFDRELTTEPCPKCNTPAPKLISAANFKGSGISQAK